ncbi:hypothetical protein ACFL47_11295, partial [Candidatus Latescibacterota bacterium]
ILKPENGRVIVIGTKKHENDLHESLRENSEYRQFIYKAIDNDGKPLWRDKWSIKRLEREKREIGSTIFAQEYQNESIDEENALFKRKWIQSCYAENETLKGNENIFNILNRRIRDRYRIFTGWDLSIVMNKEKAEEKDSDYTVGTTILLDENKNRRIIDIYRERGLTPNNIIEIIKRKHELFDTDLITIENNLFQILYQYKLIETTDLPIHGHTTTIRDKVNLYEGIPSLSVLFENGKFILPTGDKGSKAKIKLLEDELVGLGYEKHDDCLMSLWMAECGIANYKERTGSIEVINDPTEVSIIS